MSPAASARQRDGRRVRRRRQRHRRLRPGDGPDARRGRVDGPDQRRGDDRGIDRNRRRARPGSSIASGDDARARAFAAGPGVRLGRRAPPGRLGALTLGPTLGAATSEGSTSATARRRGPSALSAAPSFGDVPGTATARDVRRRGEDSGISGRRSISTGFAADSPDPIRPEPPRVADRSPPARIVRLRGDGRGHVRRVAGGGPMEWRRRRRDGRRRSAGAVHLEHDRIGHDRPVGPLRVEPSASIARQHGPDRRVGEPGRITRTVPDRPRPATTARRAPSPRTPRRASRRRRASCTRTGGGVVEGVWAVAEQGRDGRERAPVEQRAPHAPRSRAPGTSAGPPRPPARPRHQREHDDHQGEAGPGPASARRSCRKVSRSRPVMAWPVGSVSGSGTDSLRISEGRGQMNGRRSSRREDDPR